jgi:PBP1b-binding outer membrane lipoprotein LpoB
MKTKKIIMVAVLSIMLVLVSCAGDTDENPSNTTVPENGETASNGGST